MRRVLALHLGSLGDFILSWPALGLLQAGPPPAELGLIGRPEWAALLLPPERVVDREGPRLARLFTPGLSEADQAWLAGFDLAAVFSARPPDPALAANLASAGEVLVVPTRPEEGRIVHVAEFQVQALRRAGLAGPALAPPPRLGRIEAHGRPILAPGSGGRGKRLSPELAGEILAGLGRLGRPVVVLGPAEEAGYRRELTALAQGAGAEVVAEPAILDLARLLAGAGLYVGPDSGVSHLAAAVGAPCLVGFGPTDPRLWAPLGARVTVTGLAGLAGAAAEVISRPPPGRPGPGGRSRPGRPG